MLCEFRVAVCIVEAAALAFICACAANPPSVAFQVLAPDVDSGSAVASAPGETDSVSRMSFEESMGLLGHSRLQRKIVSARLLAPDRERWDGFQILIRSAWRTDSGRVSSTGEFAVGLSDITADSADLFVRAPGTASLYHPVRIGAGPQDTELNTAIVLVPKLWTIGAGNYTGIAIRISARAAMARGSDHSRFARFHRADGSARWKSVGWRATDLPLAVVFAHDSTEPAIAPADSVAFWRSVRLLEADLGAELFRPAMSYEVVESDARVMVRIDPELHANGVTSVAWGPRANLHGVEVAFRSARHLHDRAIVMHELVHTLGFGHTSSWHSLMRASTRRAARATPEDVAYVQMLRSLRQLETTSGTLHGLMAAAASENEP